VGGWGGGGAQHTHTYIHSLLGHTCNTCNTSCNTCNTWKHLETPATPCPHLGDLGGSVGWVGGWSYHTHSGHILVTFWPPDHLLSTYHLTHTHTHTHAHTQKRTPHPPHACVKLTALRAQPRVRQRPAWWQTQRRATAQHAAAAPARQAGHPTGPDPLQCGPRRRWRCCRRHGRRWTKGGE
jgi:hypothetical protein